MTYIENKPSSSTIEREHVRYGTYYGSLKGGPVLRMKVVILKSPIISCRRRGMPASFITTLSSEAVGICRRQAQALLGSRLSIERLGIVARL